MEQRDIADSVAYVACRRINMKSRFHLFSSRRGFLAAFAGLTPAMLLGRPSLSHASRAEVKDLLSQLDLESLKSGRPKRTPGFRCSESGGNAFLCIRRNGREKSVCILNDTGRFVWENCDGNHTVDEISKGLCDAYLVSFRQARTDALSFLWNLKRKGAVQ